MGEEIHDTDAASRVAKEYAAEECVGQFGEILDASAEESGWTVEFTTHTYADTYEHSIRFNDIGNVFSHDRSDQAD